MDYINYLWYGIIIISGFLFILIVVLLATVFKNKSIFSQDMARYTSGKCPTCGQILEQDWNRCPFCMDNLERQGIPTARGDVSGSFPIGHLIIKAGPDRGRIYKLDNRPITMGSSNQNDIIINDSSVSSRHLKIWFTDKTFFIQDLKSDQGTRVNNRVIDQVELYDNDLIEAGNYCFIFRVLEP